jgi:TRAP-type C4-dicarboxylate transport system permease small subunit
VQFGLLQESEMAELPMVYIYAASSFAGVSWVLFLGERYVDHVRLFRGQAA